MIKPDKSESVRGHSRRQSRPPPANKKAADPGKNPQP